jgi:hypothetical protein
MTSTSPRRDPIDPRTLIADAYAIDGISEPECRSIFLDWAIGVPVGEETRAHIETLLSRHGAREPDHPMTKVLREGLDTSGPPVRRGGRKGRPAP